MRLDRITIPPIVLGLLFLWAGLGAQDNRVEIYNIRNFTHPSYTRIVVDVGQLREYVFKELPSPDRIYVDIFQAKLNPLIQGQNTLVENGYIKKIRIAQKNQNTVRVVADLDFSKIKSFHVWHLFDPFRIVIDIYPEKAAEAEIPAAQKVPQPAQPSKDGYSLIRQLGLGIKTIVLDPGHGGADPGCVGRGKELYEKSVVLDVCQRLKTLLTENTDVEVILTRDTDIFLPVENRAVIANQKQADLFISVHANANPSKNLFGIATFFLNFSTDPDVNRVAARENATTQKNISEMKDIIEQIAKRSKSLESKELATSIQENLVGDLSKKYKYIKNLGVRGGPFWVLIGGDMPSVLVEISHLSNAREEQRLKTTGYRQNIAQGIFTGIIKYINSLGKG
jgi:N-acetylmuramoyl-L-alanine amidase